MYVMVRKACFCINLCNFSALFPSTSLCNTNELSALADRKRNPYSLSVFQLRRKKENRAGENVYKEY